MTHFCHLRILYNGKEDLQDFYIMDLGKDRLILGYPFLRMFNPQINWEKGKLKEGKLRIQSALYKHLDQLVERWQRKAHKMGNLRQDEAVFIRRTTIAQNKPVLKENPIPEQYQKYSNVFLEEEARTFPPDQEPNATIELKPGAPERIDCKVYPLNLQEQEILKKFLSKELNKGFISPAASPYTSPVFFITKKDSTEKRLVIDYRKLNEWTVPDNGPLNRIETLMQQMNGCSLFSKFDI